MGATKLVIERLDAAAELREIGLKRRGEPSPIAARSLELILRASSAALGSRCSLCLLDTACDEMFVFASSHVPASKLRRARFKPGHGLAGRVMCSGRPVYVRDARGDDRFLPLGRRRISSLLCVPIHLGNEVVGCITAVSPRPRAFRADCLEALASFARLAASVIERADEFEANWAPGEADRSDIIDLLGMISHELRTPLNAVSASIDIILSERAGTLKPLQREFLKSARLSAKHILRLAEDILDLYCAEVGQFRLSRGPVGLHDVVARAVEQLEPLALQAQVSLHNRVDTSLPSILADGRRLEQVLVNLIGNAIKFTHQDGGIYVYAMRRDGGPTVISVKDDGIGVPLEEQSKIFDSFCRASNALRHVSSGIGLGLAAAKLIVEQHGGTIWVESSPGGGSTFCFSIPSTPSIPSM